MTDQSEDAGTKKNGSRTKKITPAAVLKKLVAFAKVYQLENEEDFLEAARIYAEEAALIAQMRQILEDEGLTVWKTYKTGDMLCAHPLLSELQAIVAPLEVKEGPQDFSCLKELYSRADVFGLDLYEAGLGHQIEGMVAELYAGVGAVRRTLHKYVSAR